jgi:hypothetical protein
MMAKITIHIDLRNPLIMVIIRPRKIRHEAAISDYFLPKRSEKVENIIIPIIPAVKTKDVSKVSRADYWHLKSSLKSSAKE